MKALYAGSFDPFTVGHLEILKQAQELFDEIYIGIAHNSSKTNRSTDIQQVVRALDIEVTCNLDRPRDHVVIIDGLIANFCRENGIKYLIRGVRSANDYLYEETIADANSIINKDLRTVYFRAYEYPKISSSTIRLMYKDGYDVRPYIPESLQYLYPVRTKYELDTSFI